MLVYFAILIFQCGWITSAEDVKACLNNLGCVKGIQMPGIAGHESFEGFLGVPYAKPPVGELRLKNPEPVEPWTPKVLETMTKREDCLQKYYFLPNFPVWGLEDCLYLNIYRPKLSSSNLLPVIFYIHGGGFFSGGANPKYLGPEYFMANKGVILVTIYYRLGPFGFLSTNDTNMPGNFGLKDQNLALRWVQEHIASFGGDPQSVTIMGHSAGASSVQYHMLSQASAGLFHRAVVMSGTSLSPYATPLSKPENQVRIIAESAGIENVHKYCTKSLTKALQDMDAITLLHAGDVLKTIHNMPMVNFKPVVEQASWENAFLTDEPIDIVKRGGYNYVPTIFGYLPSKGEGAGFVLGISENETLRKEFNDKFDDHLREMLDFSLDKSTEEIHKDSQLLIDEYLQGIHEINTATTGGFAELFGDINFLYPIYKYLQLTLDKDFPIYLYQFNYRGKRSLSSMMAGREIDFGPVHTDDYIYLFHSPIVFPDVENIDVESLNFINDFVNEFVEFAKSGKPPSFTEVGECTAKSFKSAVNDGKGICNYLDFVNDGPNGGYKKINSRTYNLKRMKLIEQTMG